MRISITGKQHKVDHQLIRKALQWYARDLIPDLTAQIKIELHIVNNLIRDADMDAAVTWIAEPVKPRRFEIHLDSRLSVKRCFEILAHEMVHVKQFARGELVDNPGGKTAKWQGKRVTIRDDDGYWTQPWEIEAYGRQPGLYTRFRRDTGV